jgi:hypothetical protein
MIHSYHSEDVQQILQRAMARKQAEEFSREQLLEMASELGILPDTLQAAEQEWLVQREEIREQQAFNTYQRRAFRAHLIPYLAVNTFLILLNLITCPTYFWAVYPLTGWGLGLTLHGWSTTKEEKTTKRNSRCGESIGSITT